MPYEDLLRLVGDLKGAAEVAAAEQRLKSEEIALLKQRLQQLYADFHGLRTSATRAQEGEAQARRDLDDALRISRSKTQLLAALGHDLRQPLTVIVAALEIFERDLPSNQLQILERAKSAVARLERALGSLMEAAQLEYTAVKPHIRPFQIDPLLKEVCSQHAPDAERKGLRLTTVPCRWQVVSDPTLLGGILHNLVENAIKYTRTGRVLVGCRRRRDNLSVEVLDTGIGIAEEMLGAVFAEYQQVAPGFGGGVGLGLFIVKRSADMLGHSVAVRSTVGKGSSFAVEVPLHLDACRAGKLSGTKP